MERVLNVAVLPAGAWGTAFSIIASENSHNVSLYFRSSADCEAFQKTHQNDRRLPRIELPSNVYGTNDLPHIIKDADVVILAPPSLYFRTFYREVIPYLRRDSVILSLTKGLEKGSNFRMSQVLEEESPGISSHLAVLSGPNFASEIARNKPAASVVASSNLDVATKVQDAFSNERFKLYTEDDVIGVELGGALKNIIAIATGVSDGLDMGNNARSFLITRGLAEIVRLGVAMGAKESTFSGLSGLGDLVDTCSTPKSRNYSAGFNLAIGATPDELLRLPQTMEGVNTVESAYELSRRYDVDMPITLAVYSVIHGGLSIKQAIEQLKERGLTVEHQPQFSRS